ncbi:MAG: hypothetical protein JST21_02350 [Bacteroidetes bacterium]|nr:hypothetical protein [Bacteroidota bacterium]
MVTSIVLIIISLIIVIIAIKLLINIRKISKEGIEVKGVVFDVAKVGGTENNISYPIIRFLTIENNWITKSSKIGTIPGIYKQGKEVTIVYQSNNPNNFYIKDKFTYFIPVIMVTIALLLLLYGVFVLIRI